MPELAERRPVPSPADGWTVPTSFWYRRPRRVAQAAIGVALLVAGIGAVLSNSAAPMLRALIPLYAGAIELIGPTFDVTKIELGRNGKDEVYALTFRVVEPIQLGDGTQVRQGRGTINVVTVSASSVLRAIAYVWAVVLLWAAATWREYLVRVPLALLATPCILMFDLPVQAVGNFWDIVRIEVPSVGVSLPWVIGQFLDAGGRLGLGIAGGIIIIMAARWLDEGWA